MFCVNCEQRLLDIYSHKIETMSNIRLTRDLDVATGITFILPIAASVREAKT